MGLTLGLSELALLNTSLDGLVELGVEGGLRRDVDLVVRRHILLNGLAAIMGQVSQYVRTEGSQKARIITRWSGPREGDQTRARRRDVARNKYVPGTIALFQLLTERPVSNAKEELKAIPMDVVAGCEPQTGRVTVGRATRDHNKPGRAGDLLTLTIASLIISI